METLIFLSIVIYSIVLHEYAHGYVAYRLGDNSAKDERRLSLNPLTHINLIGTIIVPLVLLLTCGITFGYAKPMPINSHYFRNPKKGMLLTSLAGPGVNLLIALFLSLLYKTGYTGLFSKMLLAAILANISLAFINLLPIAPLDGSKILNSLLNRKAQNIYKKTESFSIFLVFFILITGLFKGYIGLLRGLTLNLLM